MSTPLFATNRLRRRRPSHIVASRPGAHEGPGKAVRNRRDPVTVIGDETRRSHWPRGWEDAGSRTIREPGDLPGCERPLHQSSRRGGAVGAPAAARHEPGGSLIADAPPRASLLTGTG